MKQLTLCALLFVACDGRPLPQEVVDILRGSPPETFCHAVAGGFSCDLTGGVSQDCDECSVDVSCRPSSCGYCEHYGLTGSSVPVHRFASLWCVPGDPNEPGRVDCTGCQKTSQPACATLDNRPNCGLCGPGISILYGCPVAGQCADPVANACPSQDCTLCI